MLYDDRVKKAAAQAQAEGHEGEGLKLRAAKLLDVDRLDPDKPSDRAELAALTESFQKFDWSKTKRAAKEQPKLF